MPAIASLEDLKSAQKPLRCALCFREMGGIGWKNVGKLWLEERTPKPLKGEGS